MSKVGKRIGSWSLWVLECMSGQVVQEYVKQAPLHYLTVAKATARDDSYVFSSRVPTLRTLARGASQNGALKQHPISVKVRRCSLL